MHFTAVSVTDDLPDVKLITSDVFEDHRGTFCEAYREHRFHDEFALPPFVQGNVSVSKKGVARGLHYQVIRPQGKLMRTVHGRTINIAVDMRQGSPTFGQSCWTLLNMPHKALWVPPGFANGFIALEENTVVAYECSAYHYVSSDRALNMRYFIPDFMTRCLECLSDKDRDAPGIETAQPVPEAEWLLK